MTPLAAKLVFVASSAIGTLSLGSTAYVVEHPRAFTPPPARPLSVNLLAPRPLPPDPVVIQEPVQLSPMVITSKKAPLIAPAARPAKTKAFVPCSDWRDMGPTKVNNDNSVGMRKMRKLCS